MGLGIAVVCGVRAGYDTQCMSASLRWRKIVKIHLSNPKVTEKCLSWCGQCGVYGGLLMPTI